MPKKQQEKNYSDEEISARKILIRELADAMGSPDPIFKDSGIYADYVTINGNITTYHDIMPIMSTVLAVGDKPVCHVRV